MARMKSSIKTGRIARFLIAPATMILAAGLSPMAQAQDDTSRVFANNGELQANGNLHRSISALEGSWLFKIEITDLNYQTITLHSLISFTGGGVVITSASVPSSPTFYGSWRQTGPHRFDAVFYGFEPDAITGEFRIRKQHLKIELTGRNQLTAFAVGYDCDLEGENCTKANTGLSTGKRILVR